MTNDNYYSEILQATGSSLKNGWFNAYVAVYLFLGSMVSKWSIKSARLSLILQKITHYNSNKLSYFPLLYVMRYSLIFLGYFFLGPNSLKALSSVTPGQFSSSTLPHLSYINSTCFSSLSPGKSTCYNIISANTHPIDQESRVSK